MKETINQPFYNGQIVNHRLNGLRGIIHTKGSVYNDGQAWNVRFDRDNYFEILEVREWEIEPSLWKVTHTT